MKQALSGYLSVLFEQNPKAVGRRDAGRRLLLRRIMKKRNLSLWAVLFWLLVWQAGSMALHSDILLVSPLRVLQTLLALIQTTRFWSSLLGSMERILGGFLLAAGAGYAAGGAGRAL